MPDLTVVSDGRPGACNGKRLDPETHKHEGELCKNIAGKGTDHVGYGKCYRHGGRTRNGKKAAALEMARAEAEATRDRMRLFGQRSNITAEQALYEEMQRSHALVRMIEDRMAEWQEEAYLTVRNELDATPDESTGAARHGESGTGLPQLIAIHTTDRAVGFTDTEWHAWIKVLREERAHLVKVAKACIDAGVEERRQAMLEANARMMRQVIQEALTQFGVDVEPERLSAVVQGSIRAIASTVAG